MRIQDVFWTRQEFSKYNVVKSDDRLCLVFFPLYVIHSLFSINEPVCEDSLISYLTIQQEAP